MRRPYSIQVNERLTARPPFLAPLSVFSRALIRSEGQGSMEAWLGHNGLGILCYYYYY